MRKWRFGKRVVEVSHPEKPMFPEGGITKEDLAGYYARVAEVMLAYLRDRPVMLQRFPDGIGQDGFYQKRPGDYFPPWLKRVTLDRKEGGDLEMLVLQGPADLVWLADQGTLTFHAWLSRSDQPELPDRMVFDLDPGGDDFGLVRRGARDLHGILERLGLTSYLMTTGSRGLHVVVPLRRELGFDQVRAFAHDVGRVLAARDPSSFTLAQRKADRGERLFIDTLRNGYAQTAVAPYSVRSLAGAPVATPVAWDELDRGGLSPRRYNLGNIFRRLAQTEDPWQGMQRHARSLNDPRARLDELLANLRE